MIPIVLNEASCLVWPECEHQGVWCINQVGETLRALGRFERNIFLLADERIGDITLGPNCLRSYLGHGAARDAIRRILTFSSKAPVSSFAALDADGSECLVGNISVRGVLYAHLLRSVSLSFATSDWWSTERIHASLHELDVEGREILAKDILVPNVSCPEHALVHKETILAFRHGAVSSGAALWKVANDWFPNLSFLARVESDLDKLLEKSVELRQVIDRLAELDSAVRAWDSGTEPRWQSKVTDESESRRDLCNFTDASGVVRNYGIHARYTPGAGRIHFRLIPENQRIEIGYIGLKLGA